MLWHITKTKKIPKFFELQMSQVKVIAKRATLMKSPVDSFQTHKYACYVNNYMWLKEYIDGGVQKERDI